MALNVTFLQANSSGTNATEYTFSDEALGDADANRWIFVGISGSTGNTASVSAVTIGGVSATIIVNGGGNSQYGCIAFANVTTGTMGDVVVTMPDEALRIGIGIYRMVGALNTTPTDTDSDRVADNPGAQITLTVNAGGFIISHGNCGNSDAITGIAWTNLTERFEENAESDAWQTGASDDFGAQDIDRVIDVDYTTSGSTGVSMVGASFEEDVATTTSSTSSSSTSTSSTTSNTSSSSTSSTSSSTSSSSSSTSTTTSGTSSSSTSSSSSSTSTTSSTSTSTSTSSSTSTTSTSTSTSSTTSSSSSSTSTTTSATSSSSTTSTSTSTTTTSTTTSTSSSTSTSTSSTTTAVPFIIPEATIGRSNAPSAGIKPFRPEASIDSFKFF